MVFLGPDSYMSPRHNFIFPRRADLNALQPSIPRLYLHLTCRLIIVEVETKARCVCFFGRRSNIKGKIPTWHAMTWISVSHPHPPAEAMLSRDLQALSCQSAFRPDKGVIVSRTHAGSLSSCLLSTSLWCPLHSGAHFMVAGDSFIEQAQFW
jgi:hypothetical protein